MQVPEEETTERIKAAVSLVLGLAFVWLTYEIARMIFGGC